ncbi:EAL domain-containing protein [Massilia sp. CF038]|uniref:EAL domain-containing protein n=1 Tax=Massilia sp. CF038 TaxID=1881045 RepID=UPI000914529D|nr:EAL domain-containing response regulator [Massilia sp. CF038]SHG70262.1 EAL domain, c-di-GMP-specific phosphodiesterase class I (or its enzymatically inactive variant) [Massilia sp. CF038]
MDISHLHFLVAEGDNGQRKHLCDMLATLGAIQMTQVSDGAAALHCFHDAFTPAVHIAIIDIGLAHPDGLELIRELAARNCRARVIIIGTLDTTLLFSVETMAQAYGLELLGTLAQPVNAEPLQEMIGHYQPGGPDTTPPLPPQMDFEQVAAGLQAREFEPYFQPKIVLETGHIKGLEVFARWLHPEHGVLGPASFMGALQKNSRIDFLDWSMIEKSVAHCRRFHEQGLPVEISINVAPETLAHPAFIQQISACVERHQIMPQYLTFETPESSVLTNDPSFLERLVRLRMLGYGLAIDDYGTGRSNLQLLARVPFTELKIDRSFVDGAARRRALGTVLSSCLTLARSLGRESCAVGVETRQDWDFLQGLGCTYAQGHHIARPMAAEAFPGWLKDWMQFFD